MEGTLINAAGIILGSIAGAALHSRLPKKIVALSMQGMGLFVLLLGISMALQGTDYPIMVASIALGAIIGQGIGIEERINAASEFLKKKAKMKDGKFSEGFVTASLIYCTGSMAVLGAIEDGLGNQPAILIAKGLIDAIISMALASTMGIGVAFSAIPVFAYQGGITLIAQSAQGFLAGQTLLQLTGVGGILLMGVGINLLEIRKIGVVNLLPALIVVLALKLIFP